MSAELLSPITHNRVLTTSSDPKVLGLDLIAENKPLVVPIFIKLRDIGPFTIGRVSKRFLGLPFLPEWVWVGPGNNEATDVANIPGLTLRRLQ